MTIAGEALEVFSSPVLLDELAHTLRCPKFATRIAGFGSNVETLIAQYTRLVSVVVPATVPRVVLHDADDDHVIAAAAAARAEWIVAGDRKHLLPIGSHQGIAIITPTEALLRLVV